MPGLCRLMYIVSGPGDAGLLALMTVERVLHVYYVPGITLFGLLGNLVCTFVLSRPSFATHSLGQYLLGLTVVNTVCLLTVLHTWMTYYLKGDLYGLGCWCQFIEFVRTLAAFLSVWYAVCIGVDRFVVVCCSRRLRSFACTRCRAKIVLICSAVSGAAVFLNISLMVGVIRHPGQPVGACITLPQFAETRGHLDKCDVVINALVPVLALVVLNSLIIARLVQRRRERTATNGYRNSVTEGEELRSVRVNTTASLVLTSVFVVLFMPLLVYRISQATKSIAYGPLRMFLWSMVCENVRCTHYALNLPVLLTFHGGFRLEIVNMCRLLKEKIVMYLASKEKTPQHTRIVEDPDVATFV